MFTLPSEIRSLRYAAGTLLVRIAMKPEECEIPPAQTGTRAACAPSVRAEFAPAGRQQAQRPDGKQCG